MPLRRLTEGLYAGFCHRDGNSLQFHVLPSANGTRQLNTSRIGENLVPNISDTHLLRRSNPFGSAVSGIAPNGIETEAPKITSAAKTTDGLASELLKATAAAQSEGQTLAGSLQSELNHAAGDLAKALGLYDFYSAHLLNYCEGYFVHGPVPNASVPKNTISKNVTACSNTSVMNVFDPQSILQEQLGTSGIDLAELRWPSEISTGLDALQKAQHAMTLLYFVAIGSMFLALVSTVVNTCLYDCGFGSFLTSMADWVAVLTLGLGSALVTATMVEATNLINSYGRDIGVSATAGFQFLALTWVAFVAISIAAILQSFRAKCLGGLL